jgi:tetratricopeptide (TPR) repeat protein
MFFQASTSLYFVDMARATPSTLTAGQALAAAAALHTQGRRTEAEGLYRAVLAANPDHFDTLNAVGVLCLERNAAQEALAPLEKALSIQPDSAEAHNNLGMALASLGRPADSISHFEKAIAGNPDFAVANNNLGNALSTLRKYPEAIACFERAIALRPGYAVAEFNLAGALAERERHAEAAEHFRKALAHKPDWVAALCGRGLALNMSNRPDEGLESYELALQLEPQSAEAHHGIGLVLQTLGRLADARVALERALALAPDKPSHHRALAEMKRFNAGDPQIAQMKRLAEGMGAFAEEQQAELHFALGKMYGDLERHGDAFPHLMAGNAIKHRLEDYDERANLEMMRHIQKVFTAGLLQRNAGLGDPSDAPVFILGMPRSGSTLTEQILASHPQVFGAGELRYLGDAAKAFRGSRVEDYFPEIAKSMSGEQLRAFGARYIEQVRPLAPGAARITDKMPANFRFIGLIRMALPNARIIHTKRDPLDTCLSCFSRLFGKKTFTSDLGTLGRYYRAYSDLMEHWRTVLPPGAMLEVQYEDLVQDFEGQARRLVDYCGLAWDARCLAFHQTSRPVRTASVTQVRQPIYRSAIGRWEPYRQFLGPLLEGLGTSKAQNT